MFKPNTFCNLFLICFCKFMKDIEPKKIYKNFRNSYCICFIFSMVKPNMRKSFFLVLFYFISLILFRFEMEPKVVLGSHKVLRKEKMLSKIIFSRLHVEQKISKENQIYIKLFIVSTLIV